MEAGAAVVIKVCSLDFKCKDSKKSGGRQKIVGKCVEIVAFKDEMASNIYNNKYGFGHFFSL